MAVRRGHTVQPPSECDGRQTYGSQHFFTAAYRTAWHNNLYVSAVVCDVIMGGTFEPLVGYEGGGNE